MYNLKTVIFAFVFAPFILTTPVSAATFSVTARLGGLGCDEQLSNNSGVRVDCGSVTRGALTATAKAGAGDGTVSARASSLAVRDTNGVLVTSTGTAFASALYVDGIRATYRDTGNAFNGRARFALDLLGDVVSDNGATTQASVNFSVNGTNLFSYNSAAASSGPDSVTPVNTGNVIGGNYNVLMGIVVRANTPCILAAGESCFSDSDLGSSLRITGLSFFDDMDNDVTDLLTVESDSGFDYVTGAAPHDRGDDPSVVPLPAGMALLFTALGGFGLTRRCNKAAA